MSSFLLGKEPDPTSPPVREFKANPGFRVVFANLTELRAAMIEDDTALVNSLAKRKLRGEAAQAEHMAHNGMRRSYNTSHWLPTILHDAKRRHPYEHGLVNILEEVYPHIATKDSPYQLYDFPVIDSIASRLNKAKQAVVFKRDKEEGIAPTTQAANIARAIQIAEVRLPGDEAFVAQVNDIYSTLVPATVAVQQTLFEQTYLIDDWDGVGFMGIDLAS